MPNLNAYEQYIRRASAAYGIPESVLKRVISIESGGNPRAQSPVGALGLMQLMPATARGLGVRNPLDPQQNIMGGAKYLRMQLNRFGNLKLALAAYNAGPGAVAKYGGVPPFPETQHYVNMILGGLGVGAAPQMTPSAVAPPAGLGQSAPTVDPRLAKANELAAQTIPDEGEVTQFQKLGSISGHIAEMQQEQQSPLSYGSSLTGLPAPTEASDHLPLFGDDKGIKLPTTYKPTHDTDGLPGFPAIDVFGRPGTVVRAPAAGVIQYIHRIPWDGKKRVGGITAYLVTPKGTYFLTHMGSISAKEGQHVAAGQAFATIGAVPKGMWQPHIHLGFRMTGKKGGKK